MSHHTDSMGSLLVHPDLLSVGEVGRRVVSSVHHSVLAKEAMELFVFLSFLWGCFKIYHFLISINMKLHSKLVLMTQVNW